MNQCAGKFVPSDQMRRPGAAEPVEAKAATKAKQEAEPRTDGLSAEELEFARKQADDDSAELARLYINGELARVGLKWLPGMEEKFRA
jgi:hypothetical protein